MAGGGGGGAAPHLQTRWRLMGLVFLPLSLYVCFLFFPCLFRRFCLSVYFFVFLAFFLYFCLDLCISLFPSFFPAFVAFFLNLFNPKLILWIFLTFVLDSVYICVDPL